MYLCFTIFACVTIASVAQRCGEAGPRPRRLGAAVTGGHLSQPGRWPWMALVGYVNSDNARWYNCGGALVTTRHVLTAAHCRTGELSKMRVRLGENDMNTDNDGKHQDLFVTRFIVHPQFRKYSNDIGLITLHKAAVLGSGVGTICLPTTSSRTSELAGRRGIVAGWGETSEFGYIEAPRLRQARVVVARTSYCENAYRRIFPIIADRFPAGVDDTILCRSDQQARQHRDGCLGDTGGPLVIRGRGGRYTVIGVVAAGAGCEFHHFPGVFTRVSEYLRWINQGARIR